MGSAVSEIAENSSSQETCSHPAMMRYWWDNIAAEALDRVQNLSKARSSVKV
jgi:hypothetical protein